MGLKKGIFALFYVVVILGLISCRSVGVSVDPETRLKERVEGFVQAREAADLIALRGFYLEPSRAQSGNIRYHDSEIIEITFNDKGKRALVELKSTREVMGFSFKNVPLSTNWVWQKGDWFMVVEDKSGNPFKVREKKSLKNDNPQKN